VTPCRLLAIETLVRNDPPSKSQPTGVNGRPRCVLEEDDDNEGPSAFKIRGLDASHRERTCMVGA
jgi:hypothetical protein